MRVIEYERERLLLGHFSLLGSSALEVPSSAYMTLCLPVKILFQFGKWAKGKIPRCHNAPPLASNVWVISRNRPTTLYKPINTNPLKETLPTYASQKRHFIKVAFLKEQSFSTFVFQHLSDDVRYMAMSSNLPYDNNFHPQKIFSRRSLKQTRRHQTLNRHYL